MTIASQTFTVDVGIFSFLNGTFVRLKKTPGESDQLELSDLALGFKAAVATYAWRVGIPRNNDGKEWHKSQV